MNNNEAVLDHICRYPRSTISDIAESLNMDAKSVKNAVQRLRENGHIKTTQGVKGMSIGYVEVPKPAIKVRPPTMKSDPPSGDPVSSPYRNGMMTSRYAGKELDPYDGRKGANDFKKYGSMVGGVIRPYAAPGSMCVSPKNNVSAPVGRPPKLTK